jgi:hypothetical protein
MTASGPPGGLDRRESAGLVPSVPKLGRASSIYRHPTRPNTSRIPWDGHFNSTQRVYDSSTNPILREEADLWAAEEARFGQGRPASARGGGSSKLVLPAPRSAKETAALLTEAAFNPPLGLGVSHYNSLEDQGLRRYYKTTRSTFLHLERNGYVTENGFVVKAPVRRMALLEKLLKDQQSTQSKEMDDVQRALSVRKALERIHDDRQQKLLKCQQRRSYEVSKRQQWSQRTASFSPGPSETLK